MTVDCLASQPVAEVSGNEGPQWPEEKADADGGEGQNLRHAVVRFFQRSQEQRRQQRCRELGKDKEVVPLDGGADQSPGEDRRSSRLLLGPDAESTVEGAVIELRG